MADGINYSFVGKLLAAAVTRPAPPPPLRIPPEGAAAPTSASLTVLNTSNIRVSVSITNIIVLYECGDWRDVLKLRSDAYSGGGGGDGVVVVVSSVWCCGSSSSVPREQPPGMGGRVGS